MKVFLDSRRVVVWVAILYGFSLLLALPLSFFTSAQEDKVMLCTVKGTQWVKLPAVSGVNMDAQDTKDVQQSQSYSHSVCKHHHCLACLSVAVAHVQLNTWLWQWGLLSHRAIAPTFTPWPFVYSAARAVLLRAPPRFFV